MYAENFRELARVNTGTHMLDSGGIYGRHWQRPGIPSGQPLEYWDGSESYPMLMVSTAQLLDEHLEIDQAATRHFRLWAAIADPKDNHSWLELMGAYLDRMVATGRWDSDSDGTFTDNSYNWETDLDQDFQFAAPGLYGDRVLVQMHNGADVRGGYTAPVVAAGELESVLCDYNVRPFCQHCERGADNMYYGERDGWKLRVNRQSCSVICPDCKRVARCYPKSA